MPEKSTSSPLKCCQSNDSLVSVSQDDTIVCETTNSYVKVPTTDVMEPLNNNVIIPENMKSHYIFPKRQKVDLEFKDVTFSSTSWSMTKFERGEFFFYLFKMFVKIVFKIDFNEA